MNNDDDGNDDDGDDDRRQMHSFFTLLWAKVLLQQSVPCYGYEMNEEQANTDIKCAGKEEATIEQGRMA